MMDALSDPAIAEVVFMTASQIGKTDTINNLVGFHIDRDPAPMLFLQPTLDMAQAWSKDRLAPMLRDTPCLRGKVRDARSRDSNNTVLHKIFTGGHITVAGANSAASLASRPIRIVICDEVDRYPASAGTEGDPVSLAAKRSRNFWNRKLVLTSTPTVRGASRIEAAWEASDQRRYFVRCPMCEHAQVMAWEQVKWAKDAKGQALPETAKYHCAGCKESWTEAERMAAVLGGEWRATAAFTGTAGFHLNALVSPWVKLSELVKEWVAAQKSPELLRVFINTALGESWVPPEEQGIGVAWKAIRDRSSAEPDVNPDHHLAAYKLGDVPPGVLMIFAGVDTQDNRYAPVVYGFGRGEEAWLLYWGEIFGDPVYDETAQQLDSLLARKFTRGPTDLPILGAAIDSGGHRAQAVYNFARARAPKVIATKGMSRPGLPIIAGKPTAQDVAWGGKLIRGGVQLWPVGADTAKSEIYARLRLPSGPRSIHFPSDLPDEFYEQLVSEVLITKFNKGVPYREWFLPPGKRNETLDATALAFAAAIRGGIQRVNWEQLEATMIAPAVTQMAPQVVRSRYVHG